MKNKRMRLPREGAIEPQGGSKGSGPVNDDVEGHGFANPAPPAGFSKRSPSQGGDVAKDPDDGAGRRL
jgi:hypothetical protein